MAASQEALQELIAELNSKVSSLATEVTGNAAKIFALIEQGGNDEKIKRLDDLQESIKAEQASVAAQVAHAAAQLAQAQGELPPFIPLIQLLEELGPKFTSDTLPKIHELEAYINAEFTGTVYVDATTFKVFMDVAKANNVDVGDAEKTGRFLFLKRSTTCYSMGDLNFLWIVADFAHLVTHKSEDSVHAAVSFAVQHFPECLLRLMNVIVGTDRNTTEGSRPHQTVSGTCRPDSLLFVNYRLVLRGEEKRHGAKVPANELTDKMVHWSPIFYASVPYVLGYALAGTKIQFYILHPSEEDRLTNELAKAAKTKLGRELDLGKLLDRFKLIEMMFKLVRVMEALGELGPVDAPMINVVYRRAGSGQFSTILFADSYVKKVLKNAHGVEPGSLRHFDFAALKELYRLVEERKVVNTIRLDSSLGKPLLLQNGDVQLVLRLSPLGYPVLPTTAESLRCCLLMVLGALESMHEHGFCHCDVRWPNIVQLANNQQWMLIDLDFARKVDVDGTTDWPFWVEEYDGRVQWPDRRGGAARWSPAEDVWMVGELLMSVKVEGLTDVDLQRIADEVKECRNCVEAKRVVEE